MPTWKFRATMIRLLLTMLMIRSLWVRFRYS